MKKTYKYLSVICILSSVLFFSGCKDYLTEIEPGTDLLEDFYTSTEAAVQNVTACYVPLMWEYNQTYFPEWFIGDILSDDALKGGGSTTDMSDAYDFENWRTTSGNTLVLDFYRAQYQGIARCNLALKYISNMQVGVDENFTSQMKERLLAEAYFLRAYYNFRLVRVFAGVPLILDVVDSSDKWGQPRASVDAIFVQILSDLEQAEAGLFEKSAYAATDAGRATKGAAQAMLMKVNLYMASPYWQTYGLSKTSAQCYADAKKWGEKIIGSGEYTLLPNYEDNFTLEGENGLESVFEIQYAEVPWGDYGEGNGFTAGSFTQILERSRSGKIGGGWGFNHPSQNLYDEFEAGDPRRDVAILLPHDSLIQSKASEYYLGNKMLNNKYGMYRDSTYTGAGYGKWGLHASRGPLNNRQIRYADVLLMYAEACLGAGDAVTAKDYINDVRARVGLAGISVADDAALRHERRCELAMEGHRWFDIVRWNIAAETIAAYEATESEEYKAQVKLGGGFKKGKHEILPIPYDEILLNPTKMEQNPGYN
ncbi:MAG: RagB/SusD family nutrient uptake outer membrane protein [Paludibacteraceae bacterium]|nr:RagB/SusD family nutrient uptake outer membrane protein [Paludibacteraceae bacterium]